ARCRVKLLESLLLSAEHRPVGPESDGPTGARTLVDRQQDPLGRRFLVSHALLRCCSRAVMLLHHPRARSPQLPGRTRMIAVTLPALALAIATAPNLGVLHQYAAVALSADGQKIASVETVKRPYATTEEHGAVVVRSASGEVLSRLDPCENCRYSGVTWSPRGQRLAFVASADGTATLYEAIPDPIRKGELVSHRITAIKGLLASPRWSPDTRSLAVLVTAGAHKQAGATQAGAREVGEMGQIDDFQRIALVDAAGGEPRFVSADGLFVYEYDWMPDGRGFVGTADPGNGDDNWWIAKLMSFSLDGAAHVVAAPEMQMNFPRVAPDGRHVAFIGGLMSDFGSVGGDFLEMDMGSRRERDGNLGGTASAANTVMDNGAGVGYVDATPGYKGSFTSIAWRGKQLIASVVMGGQVGTAVVDPRGKQVSEVHLQ